MNRKLRLLVTAACPNSCPMCCNRKYDLEALPVVDRWDYDEISLTGGEPLMFTEPLAARLADSIRTTAAAQGLPRPKIYLYTACFRLSRLIYAAGHFDGITLTPHRPGDIKDLCIFNDAVLKTRDIQPPYPITSLRLNLFPDMKALLPETLDLSMWRVKDLVWLDDCPLPAGEDFRRIANLW